METEVAKIEIGNPKQSTTFVYLVAETIKYDGAELYLVLELPLFNPAAKPDCEKIAQAIAGSLRRNFRGEVNDSNFENAVAEINEELAKLTNLGQENWVGKLNAVLATKIGSKMQIATTGKVVAMMLRDGEFVSLSDTPKRPNPGKTFENFATGKVNSEDLFLLSTVNVFNHSSMEDFKRIIKNNALNLTANQIADKLRNSVSPEVSIGTLVLLFSDGSVQAPRFISEKIIEPSESKIKISHKIIKSVLTLVNKIQFRKPNFKNATGKLYNFASQSKEFVSSAKVRFPSKQKKILFISAGVLLVALIVNIAITKRVNETKQETVKASSQISDLEKILQDADASMVYKDITKAKSLLNSFNEKQKTIIETKDISSKLTVLRTNYTNLVQRFEKNIEIKTTEFGSLGNGSLLLHLPNTIATQSGDSIVSYDFTSQKIQQGVLKCTDQIITAIYWKEQKFFIYNSQNLAVCDFATGNVNSLFSGTAPAAHEFGAMGFYPTATKLYTVNKASKEIISYEMSGDQITKFKTWATDPSFAETVSMTIDTAIYVYGPSGIHKFLSGKAQELAEPDLLTPLSGNGKIYTHKEFTNLYVLDTANNRIVILNKKGDLVGTITDSSFTELKDFVVDEAKKTIYLLNKDKLVKVNY